MHRLSFFRKEIKEILRTHKIIVLPAILLFFGLSSPIIARFMNTILEPALKNQGIDPAALLKEPTLMDAYMQFFNNFLQIVLIAIVLIFMGAVVDEKVKGSAILVLTKSVSRAGFIISKFFSAVLLFTVSYVLSVLAFCYYSYVLFSKAMLENTIVSFFTLWLLGVFIISVTIFASTIGKSHIMSAVIGFAGYAAAMALSAIPYIKEYSPGYLGSLGLEILKGTKDAGDTLVPIITAFILCIAFIGASIGIFKRQEL